MAAATVAFASPVRAQRQYTVLPEPSAFDSLPTSISMLRAPANTESLSTIRIPQNPPGDKPGKAPRVCGVERMPSRRNWILLSAVEHGAATFDAYSTRQAIGGGAVERDPMMRPFAGSPAMYLAIQGGPLLLDYAARKMQRSHYEAARKLWWMPQTAATAVFIASGTHNMNVAAGRR
jgi:hypothetical protein